MAQHTKNAMAQSLKKLLSKNTLDKITIQEIADDCDVNRQTFYYHFQDVYALIEWIVNNETLKALGSKSDTELWNSGFMQLLEMLRENKQLVTNLYRSISRERLEEYLGDIVYRYLYDIAITQSEGMAVTEEDKKFVAIFYKYPFVGLLLDWVKNGMIEEPQYLVDMVCIILKGNTKGALARLEIAKQ